MQQWEYTTIVDSWVPARHSGASTLSVGGEVVPMTAAAAMSKLGSEGWELVTMSLEATADLRVEAFYFKRPLQ